MNTPQEKTFVQDVMTALTGLEYDVTRRNDHMLLRDRCLYGDGLYSDLDIEDWFAQVNLVKRVVDIHTAQLMGRGFNIYSYYNKEDIAASEDPNEQKMAELRNKKRKANSDARKRAVEGIIRDNGGMAIFKDGARIGSSYGETVYKMWYDKTKKKVNITLLESPQNWRAFWADSNFRERDADGYVYQISLDQAMRKYGSKLAEGEVFDTTKEGMPFMVSTSGDKTNDPLGQLSNASDKARDTDRTMVTVVDLTGFIAEYEGDGETIKKVKRGDEKALSVMIVGGKLVQVISKEELLPRYYRVANRVQLRRPFGESDISDSMIDLNKEIVQLMADETTWANKNLFKLIQAKGFTPESIPKKKARRQQVVAMSQEQSLEEVDMKGQPLSEWKMLIDQKMDMFVRLAGVGRVLFDDPSVNANSNQALMTTLKGVVDIVEDKQSRWEPALRDMFTDALNLASTDIPELKDAVQTDEDWFLCVEWPSVLRREDASYQQMWLNLFNAGVVSWETYLEKIGMYDTGEEMDRVRDEMKDPIAAAVMGRALGEMAHQTLNKALGIPPWGYITPKVNLKGELAPQEVGNMAHNYGWDQGPYGDAIGPTGMDGQIAADNFMNAGFLNGNPRDGGSANYQGPTQPANPQLTTDQNTGQAASQPGSGAPAVSPAGAIAQNNQNQGR